MNNLVSRKAAPGRVETVVYFERADGHMIIPMRNDLPAPSGYQRVECNTLADVTAASKRFAAQKQREFDFGDAAYHARQEQVMNEHMSNLRQRMMSADCTQFERDFIRRFIQKIEAERSKHHIKRELYFHQEAHEASTKSG